MRNALFAVCLVLSGCTSFPDTHLGARSTMDMPMICGCDPKDHCCSMVCEKDACKCRGTAAK